MPSPKNIRWIRRAVQAIVFLIFIWLLIAAFYNNTHDEGDNVAETLDYPVSLFLKIDPLTALLTFLSTGTVYADLLWALFIIVPTLFLGRWFCGWFCPFGTLHNFFSEIFKKKASLRIKRNRTGLHQTIKYMLLFFFIGSALFGFLWLAGVFDPISFLIRSLGLSILPAIDYVARGSFDILPSETISHSLHKILDSNFLGPDPFTFHGAWIIGGLFMLVIGLNLYMSRFWCRIICPLGAFLGLMSRFTLLNVVKNDSSCKKCNLCVRDCQGAASPEKEAKWRPSECLLCYNCVANCPEQSIEFKFKVQASTTDPRTDLSRRGFISSFALGAAAYPLLRSTRDPDKTPEAYAIRPPGSCKETEFLARCVKCGQCMKICPNNAIHPALFQTGVEGIWSPVVIPRIGYCEPTCSLCSKVCPTGAIRIFTTADKKANKVKIGTAFFNRGRCLPWAMNKECLICEEFCPTSPKAIWFETREVTTQDGTTIEMKLPHVDPARCTGCGGCENVCVVADIPAVAVTSVGESRSKVNRILLREDGS